MFNFRHSYLYIEFFFDAFATKIIKFLLLWTVDMRSLSNKKEGTFVLEFATIIKNLVGTTSDIKHTTEVEDDPQRRRPDITRAKAFLHWEPKVPLTMGLKKTVKYFRKELMNFKQHHNSKALL